MRLSAFRQFDGLLLFSAILLSGLGLISIMSLSQSTEVLFSPLVLRQGVLLIVGIGMVLILSRFEYRTLQSYSRVLFLFALCILGLVLIFGTVQNGARAWFQVAGWSLQPSEPAKLAFILMLGSYFSNTTVHSWKHIIGSLPILILPVGLILLQPDLGSALVYIVIWFCMVLSLNLPFRQLLGFLLASIAGATVFLTLLLHFLPTTNYQYQRLQIFPDHLFLRSTQHIDSGYQVDQAIIAIGSGGWSGTGLGQGTQSRLGFLPAPETDFIFASIAEELGVIGILLLFILLSVLLLRTLRVARLAQDRFGRLVSVGIFGLFFYHAVQNIGMNMGLLPVTGIPLAFVSYGGSHLLTSFVGIGLLESIILRYKKINY